MTLGYNYSRVKIKTRVWDIDEIYSYNNIVNCVNYCVNNIDKNYNNNNNGENNKSKSYNNDNNRELENDNNCSKSKNENGNKDKGKDIL